MIKTDKKILDTVQKISDWLQDVFGITNFDTAQYIVIPLVVLLQVIDQLSRIMNGKTLSIFTIVWVIMLVATVPKSIVKIKRMVAAEPNFRNPLEILLIPARCQVLLLIPFMMFFLTSLIGFCLVLFFVITSTILLTLNLYFVCCTPKPPSKSKLKKAIEKVKSFRISLPQTSPTLSPG